MTRGLLQRCTDPSCGEYTLRDTCPRCGAKALDPRPAKYSPEDHYGEYRRRLKRLDRHATPPKPNPASGPPAPPATPTPP